MRERFTAHLLARFGLTAAPDLTLDGWFEEAERSSSVETQGALHR